MNASESPGPSGVVSAGDDETRILLRGLLRLNRVRVLGEASGTTHGLELVRQYQPSILLIDSDLAEGSVAELILGARAILPTIRIVLITPAASAPASSNTSGSPDAILVRPFEVRKFTEAVRPTEATAPPNPT